MGKQSIGPLKELLGRTADYWGEGKRDVQDSVGVPLQCERELFFVTPKAVFRDVKHFRTGLLILCDPRYYFFVS